MCLRKELVALAAFVSGATLLGGLRLMHRPGGSQAIGIELLAGTPFSNFLLPGLMLALLLGIPTLLSAILLWRESPLGYDLGILAGGALTLWTVAEFALLPAGWHHPLFALLGLTLLGLSAAAGWREQKLRTRWVLLITCGEGLGFLVPVTVGVLAHAQLSGAPQVLVLASAGFFEGLCLGAAQAWAFPAALNRRRFALLTALAASGVWALVMATMLLFPTDARPGPLLVGLMPVVICAALTSIGSAQWLELRRHFHPAWSWIAWTAAAWLLALPMSFLPSPLVDESTPVGVHLVLWGGAGIMMAYTMAVVTWQGVRRLTRQPLEESSASLDSQLAVPHLRG